MTAEQDPAPEFGRYRVIGRLGAGGMGVVYEAEDPEIGRRVAIKATQLDPNVQAAFGDEMRERFEREFRAAGQLSHPHIVTVYDVGIQEGVRWVAMELTAGGSLKELLDRLAADGRRIPRRRVADLARQVGAALDYAHGRGMIHRDVKPANILLTADELPKLADFGLVKTANSELTATQAVLGTLPYMAPELLTGEGDGPPSEASPRSDQYSFACVLYETMTGIRPHNADSAGRLVLQIAREAPRPPTEIEPGLTPEVDSVLLRALSKEPQQRFADCSELARHLARALDVPDASSAETGPVNDPLADTVLDSGALPTPSPAPATPPGPVGPESLPTAPPPAAASPTTPAAPAPPAATADPVTAEPPAAGAPGPPAPPTPNRRLVLPLALVIATAAVLGAWQLGWPGGADPSLPDAADPGIDTAAVPTSPSPPAATGADAAQPPSRGSAETGPSQPPRPATGADPTPAPPDESPTGEPVATGPAPIRRPPGLARNAPVAVMGGATMDQAVPLPQGMYTLTAHLPEREYTYFRVPIRSGQAMELMAEVTRNIPTAEGEGLHTSNVRVYAYDGDGVEIRNFRAVAIGQRGTRETSQYVATSDGDVLLGVGADFNDVHRDSLFGYTLTDAFDADSGRDLPIDSDHVLAMDEHTGSIGLQDSDDRYRIDGPLPAGTELSFIVTPNVEMRLQVELLTLDGRRLGRTLSRRGANTLRVRLEAPVEGAYLLISDQAATSNSRLARYRLVARMR